MPEGMQIILEGLNELQADLRGVNIQVAFGHVAEAMTRQVIEEVKPYPLSLGVTSFWNGEPRWYERGTGWMPYGPFRSEDLGGQWYSQVRQLEAEVGNTAPYADWVQGPNQTQRHQVGGWKQLYTVAEDKAEDFVEHLADEIERQLAGA